MSNLIQLVADSIVVLRIVFLCSIDMSRERVLFNWQ